MPDKYIVMSDLHLGQTGKDGKGHYSLLSRYSRHDRRKALAEHVHDFACDGNVTLVGVGDILDLSLAYWEDALLDLRALFELLPSVNKFVWVIGNHDHHVWSAHSEDQRCFGRLRAGKAPLAGGVYRSTNGRAEPCQILQAFLPNVELAIAYPYYVLESAGGSQAAYFTHGHLFGGLYTTITSVLSDRLFGFPHATVAATVNAPIIEFIYWLLGETGEGFGSDGLVEEVLTEIQKGETGHVEPLVVRAVELLLPDGVILGVPDKLERKAVTKMLMKMLEKAIAQEATPGRSRDRHKGVDAAQRDAERWIRATGIEQHRPCHFVFGHTHKAFQAEVHSTAIQLYNTGSWLIEPTRTDPDTTLLTMDVGEEISVERALVR